MQHTIHADINNKQVHPGIILKEYIEKSNLNQTKVAKLINVNVQTVNAIANEKRGISNLISLKLAKLFNTSDNFWAGIYAKHKLSVAYEKHKNDIDFIEVIKGSNNGRI